MEITINNKTITLKRTFRSYIIYESATGKPFAPKTLTDSITFFYCTVIASDQEIELTFDEFLGWLDDHESAFQEFTDWLVKQNEIDTSTSKKKARKTKKESK